jgi:hypothetical protein
MSSWRGPSTCWCMQSIILQLTAADVTRRDVRALPDDDGHMFRSGIISRGVSLAVMLVPWNPIKWGGGGGDVKV